MEYKNKVVVDRTSTNDKDGFTRTEGQCIVDIFDKTGKCIHHAITADNAEAIKALLHSKGYRLTSSWANGIADIGMSNATKGCLVSTAIIITLIAAVTLFIILGPKSSPYDGSGGTENSKIDSEFAARDKCAAAVKARLSAPSTADIGQGQAERNGTTWEIKGTVDAENGYGATVRKIWICTVESNGATTVRII